MFAPCISPQCLTFIPLRNLHVNRFESYSCLSLRMVRDKSTSRTRTKNLQRSLSRSSMSDDSVSSSGPREMDGSSTSWMRSNSLWNLPNILSIVRVFLIPVLAAVLYSPWTLRGTIAFIIFLVASLTDFVDGFDYCQLLRSQNSAPSSDFAYQFASSPLQLTNGASLLDSSCFYLARRWRIESPFGAFLDPVADKLMVSTVLVLLAKVPATPAAAAAAAASAASAATAT